MSFSHMPVSQSCPVNPSTHWHLFRPTHNPPFLHDGEHFKGSEEGNTNTRKKSVSVRKVVCSWVRFVFVCSPIWQRAPSQPSKQLQVLMSTHLPPLTHGGEQRATHTHKHKCEILVHSNNVTHTHILTYETLRSGVVWGTLTGVWSDTPSTITTRQITHRWDKHTSTSNQCHTVCVCVCVYVRSGHLRGSRHLSSLGDTSRCSTSYMNLHERRVENTWLYNTQTQHY